MPNKVTGVNKPTKDKAKSEGKKKVEGRSREYIEGNLEVIPNCDYTVSNIYELSGLGKIFSGSYYIQRATHTINTSGYNVQLDVTMVDGSITKNPDASRKEPVGNGTSKDPANPKLQVITIKWGDTLTTISKKYGTTVKELVRINGIKNPDLIYAGKTLKVPVK